MACGRGDVGAFRTSRAPFKSLSIFFPQASFVHVNIFPASRWLRVPPESTILVKERGIERRKLRGVVANPFSCWNACRSTRRSSRFYSRRPALPLNIKKK
nr:hypothetical protein [Candidatus Sigynarchaeum springense]